MAIFSGGVGGARALTPEQLAAQQADQLARDRITAANFYKGAIPGLDARMKQDPALGVDANLLATGTSTAPLTGGITEGIARVLSGLAGGQFQRKDMQPYTAAENVGTSDYLDAVRGQRAQDAIDRANEHAERVQLLGAMTGQRTTAPGTSVINPNATTPTPPGLTPDQAAPLQAARTVAGAFNNAPGVPVPNNVAMLGPQGGPLGAGPALPQQQGAAPAPSALPTNPIVSPASSGAAPTASTDADLLNRITVKNESHGNPNAVSPVGAKGLMQVMGPTSRDPGFGLTPSNGTPEDDVRLGQDYRAKMQQRYGGDVSKMWAAYNAGPGRTDRAIRNYGNDWLSHMPAQTQGYVAKNLADLHGATGGVTGGTGQQAPTEIPKPTLQAVVAAPPPPTMPAEIPLPERIQSARLGIADRLLSGAGSGNSALTYMMAQPLIDQGLTEDQASKQSAYDAAVKSVQARQQAGLNLYNQEAETAYRQPFDERTAAILANTGMTRAEYDARVAAQSAQTKFGYDTSLEKQRADAATEAARIKATADAKEAVDKLDAQLYKVPNATRVRWGNNVASLNAIDEAIREVNARPQSFNVAYGAMGNDAANKLDPDGARARAAVQRVASQVEVAAGGTRAMAPGEQAIFARYQPTKYSNARTVLDLLQSHRSYIDSENKSYEFAYGKNRFAAPDSPYMLGFPNAVAGSLPAGVTVTKHGG